MTFDLLQRRKENFVLWIPGRSFGTNPPQLVIGTYDASAKDPFVLSFKGPFVAIDFPDLWQLDPKTISPPLKDGVYHYWFELADDSANNFGTMQMTDPMA